MRDNEPNVPMYTDPGLVTTGASGELGRLRRSTSLERLKQQKVALEHQLELVNAALTAAEKNPDLVALQEAFERALGGY